MDREQNRQKITDMITDVYPRLERFAFSICRTREEAQDVTGETILQVIEKIGSLKEEKAFLSFVFTIASRVKIMLYRKSKKYQTMEPDVFDYIKSDTQSPEDSMDVKLLYEALDKLNYNTKEAVILFDIIGLSYNEISSVQSSNLSAVKLRIYRGRRKLAELLKAENDLFNQTPELEGVNI